MSWKLFAPLSVERSPLLVEYCLHPQEALIRLGGAKGALLRPYQLQELLVHLMSRQPWTHPEAAYAPPKLHLGARSYTLSESARLTLVETFQALLVEIRLETSQPPLVQEGWQRTIVQLDRSSFVTLEDGLATIAQAARQNLGLSGVNIWLRAPGTPNLLWKWPGNSPSEQIGPQTHPVFFTVLERSLVLAIEDTGKDARVAELRPWLIPRGVRALMQVAVHTEEGLGGVLWLESAQPRSWSSEEQAFAALLGHLLGRLLEAERFRSTAERIKALEEKQRPRLMASGEEFRARLGPLLIQAKRGNRSLALVRIALEPPPGQNIPIARELASGVRQSDLVADLENGQFVFLGEVRRPGGGAQLASRLFQRLRAALGRQAGLSLGLALFPQDASDPEELWNRAAQACQQAQAAGGGIRLAVPEAVDLENALARGELELHFQPLYRLATSQLAAVEALARWRKGAKIQRSASEFLPIAEQAGLMEAGDRWTLQKVLEQATVFQSVDPSVQFTLNLSTDSLLNPEFPRTLAALVAERSLAPGGVVLEIREEALLYDLATLSQTLRALKGIGVRIALDDFGANPLPFCELQRCSPDWLKLSPTLCTLENARLAKALVELAHALGAQAVAKGLETQEQVDAMRELGFDLGQGHALGRPVPAEDLGALLVWGVGR
ncbi:MULTISPECIES: sensor domain-containing phosphodiesterase [unclassified Meiothermus]|uniref:EAL domain-containing protein n=1 Tax=unclassified Meiothermus TaxID=370471 RepID=UPI001022A0D6|nr:MULTISPECIES: sensor domain-containing phosphodiesterase [unclassified Meiothermus]RYM39523.1 sensor domain-containing phosphodiesterase [Meiothermus sp. PNK-Is4]